MLIFLIIKNLGWFFSQQSVWRKIGFAVLINGLGKVGFDLNTPLSLSFSK